jgi:hypothetical protein
MVGITDTGYAVRRAWNKMFFRSTVKCFYWFTGRFRNQGSKCIAGRWEFNNCESLLCVRLIPVFSPECVFCSCNRFVRGVADKSLARPGRKRATATKLGFYSTYSPRSSIHFLTRCSNFLHPQRFWCSSLFQMKLLSLWPEWQKPALYCIINASFCLWTYQGDWSEELRKKHIKQQNEDWPIRCIQSIRHDDVNICTTF